jgi:hypothetical protein
MKKGFIAFVVTAAVILLVAPTAAFAGWNISIAIPLPGLFYYYNAPPAPPPVAPPPAAYAPPAVEPGPVFYGGYWYVPAGDRWFISAQYGGPWYGIASESVPVPVLNIPLFRGHSGHRGGAMVRPWGGTGREGHGHSFDGYRFNMGGR